MNRPTTEKRIKDFMISSSPNRPLIRCFEVYIAIDNKIYGHNIDWLSEKKIIEGYDQVWRFSRGAEKIIVATNSKLLTVDYAKQFAAAISDGRYETVSISLENLGA